MVRAFAYLTAVVLVVIGIGVSLVGGQPLVPAAAEYGHGELSFSASFPSEPVSVHAFPSFGGGGVTYSASADGGTLTMSVTALRTLVTTASGSQSGAQLLEHGSLSGLSGVTGSYRDHTAVFHTVRCGHTTDTGLRLTATQNSDRTTFTVQRSVRFPAGIRLCRVVQFASNINPDLTSNGVVWFISASSRGNPALAQAFVSSFQLPSWGDMNSGISP
jgi:hypothetical protein